MAQFTVRNLEDDVRNRLRERARRHGRSMEEEVREILRAVVMTQPETAEGLGTRIANRFKGLGFDHDIPELRDQPARAANFDE